VLGEDGDGIGRDFAVGAASAGPSSLAESLRRATASHLQRDVAALRAKQSANLAWIRALYAAVDPALSRGAPGSYVNYADEDLAEGEWQARCYGANHARLQQVKAAVDPSDFFRGRQTVRLP
jgi:hypothetical protein